MRNVFSLILKTFENLPSNKFENSEHSVWVQRTPGFYFSFCSLISNAKQLVMNLTYKHFHSFSQTSLAKVDFEEGTQLDKSPRLSFQESSTAELLKLENKPTTRVYRKLSQQDISQNSDRAKLYRRNVNCLELPNYSSSYTHSYYKPSGFKSSSHLVNGGQNLGTTFAGSKSNLFGSVLDVVEGIPRIRPVSEQSSVSRNFKVSFS